MSLLIQNVNVLNGNNELIETDVFVGNGVVEAIGKDLRVEADRTVDGGEKLLSPEFNDIHFHLREPGGEHKKSVRLLRRLLHGLERQANVFGQRL